MRRNNGQSLLEVLVALGVALLIVVGLTTLAVYGLRGAQHGKNVETATSLVGEGIEQVRTVRDRQGWTNFRNYSFTAPANCYTVDTTSWILNSVSCVVSGGQVLPSPFDDFSREIKLTDSTTPEGEGRQVTVTVFWQDAQGQNQISSDTILTQWQ